MRPRKGFPRNAMRGAGTEYQLDFPCVVQRAPETENEIRSVIPLFQVPALVHCPESPLRTGEPRDIISSEPKLRSLLNGHKLSKVNQGNGLDLAVESFPDDTKRIP